MAGLRVLDALSAALVVVERGKKRLRALRRSHGTYRRKCGNYRKFSRRTFSTAKFTFVISSSSFQSDATKVRFDASTQRISQSDFSWVNPIFSDFLRILVNFG